MTTTLRNNALAVEPRDLNDPGDAGAIDINQSGFVNIVTTGAETRTIAAPTFVGQRLQLNFKTDGGDCTITVTNGYDQSGNTVLTFNDAGDSAVLVGIQTGSNLRWRIDSVDGPIVTAAITDPGNAGAIPVTASGYVNLVTTGAETRTLAAPTFVAQRLQLNFITDGGDCVLTVTNGWNQIGNTVVTFDDAGDSIELIAAQSGATLRWRIAAIDGPIIESEIADPGNAGAIPVLNAGFVNLVTAGAETRTLAAPLWAGQLLQLHLQTDAGDCVLTVTDGFNQIGNTVITFDDAGDSVILFGVQVGANLRWRVVSIDGPIIESEIADPGNAGAIPVLNAGFVNLVTGGAETRTLAAPLWVGQLLQLHLQTDGGDCVLTVTNGWNQIGNTVITFDDEGDSVILFGVQVGANLRWRIVSVDGPIAKPEIADPGDGNAIPVTDSGYVNLVTGGAGETRTLAVPTFEGQLLQMNFQTDGGGDCVITTATAMNQTGNNTLTFADAGDHQILQGAILTAALVWREVANDGVGLTTV